MRNRDSFRIEKSIELNDILEMIITLNVSYYGGEPQSWDSPGEAAEAEVIEVTGARLVIAGKESPRLQFKTMDEAFIHYLNDSDEVQEQLLIEIDDIIGMRQDQAEEARADAILERQELEDFEGLEYYDR